MRTTINWDRSCQKPMGDLVNARLTTILAVLVSLAILGLNAQLLLGLLTGA